MKIKPLVCSECGTIFVIDSVADACPHCASACSLTVSSDDPKYLVFHAFVERIGRIEGTKKLVPTDREMALLNHGDQLYYKDGIVRILAKTYGRQGKGGFFWVQRYFNHERVSFDEETANQPYRLHILPPAIPGHVLNQISREDARELYTFPISQNPVTKELLVLCGSEDHFVTVQNAFPDRSLSYWLCRRGLIREGLRSFYSTAEISCRSGLEYECPLSWENLAHTDTLDVRFCDQCNERVYFVTDSQQRKFHSKRGHCVAFNSDGIARRTMGIGFRERFEED